MAVDPAEPEKVYIFQKISFSENKYSNNFFSLQGVFTASFSIPSSCTCSIVENKNDIVITTSTTRKPLIERNKIERR